LASLSTAFNQLLKAALVKASGAELLDLLHDLLDSLRLRQSQAEGAVDLFKYLRAICYVYARTSLLAQCTTIRLTGRARGLTDDEVQELAHDDVMKYFAQLLRDSTV
jgi:hypothetical protein